MNIIIFIIILLVLVVSHEFGHFIVAKKSGIRVDEFAFGMGPKLFSYKRGETTYKINLFPIGGYVKIFGEDPNEDSIAGPDKARSFVNKPKYIQAAVMFAGVAMNFLVAWILLSFGFMSGLPSSVDSAPVGSTVRNAEVAVVSVMKDSPAELAGLKVGDRITHLSVGTDNTDVPSLESLKYFMKKHSTDDIVMDFHRGPERKQTHITPKDGVIGISMDLIGTLKLPVHKALLEGLKLTTSLTKATAVGFYTLIHNALVGKGDINSISGPVGIVGVVGDAAKFGFIYLLSFTALISVNLAVINLIPFPALDGGRLLFLLIEKIKGSRIKPEIGNMLNMVGFGILMLLMIVITYHDIVKLL
jgi:regulator of sigma E protease